MDVSSIYQAALAQQNQIYSSVTAGYNNLMQAQMAAEAQVAGGYNTLSGTVQGAIQGVDASQRQAIQDTYQNQWGHQQQQMINSGLGNSTVLNSVNRGLVLDENKAEVALSNQMAQLKAGYLSQIGLAGLGYQGQAVQANTALGSQGLNAQAGMGNTYASIYGGYGQAALGQQALQNQMTLGQQQLGLSRAGMGQQGYAAQQGLQAQKDAAAGQLGYQYAALNQMNPGLAPSYSSLGSGGNLWGSTSAVGYGAKPMASGGGGLAGGYGSMVAPWAPNADWGAIGGGEGGGE